jgi:hypothetical protein
MKNKKDKNFDCLAMKHAAQEVIRAQVRGMSIEEEVAYISEKAPRISNINFRLQNSGSQRLPIPRRPGKFLFAILRPVFQPVPLFGSVFGFFEVFPPLSPILPTIIT